MEGWAWHSAICLHYRGNLSGTISALRPLCRASVCALFAPIREHPCRIFAVQTRFHGVDNGHSALKSLALPRGLEPLFSP